MTHRFSTLLKRFGTPYYTDGLTPAPKGFLLALAENRVLTVHHGETCNARFWGEVGKYPVNVVGFCVFPKPLPPKETYIVGIEHRLGDLDIC